MTGERDSGDIQQTPSEQVLNQYIDYLSEPSEGLDPQVVADYLGEIETYYFEETSPEDQDKADLYKWMNEYAGWAVALANVRREPEDIRLNLERIRDEYTSKLADEQKATQDAVLLPSAEQMSQPKEVKKPTMRQEPEDTKETPPAKRPRGRPRKNLKQ